jgi:hypothetical protein
MAIIPPSASPRFTFNGNTPEFHPAQPKRPPFAQITRPFISDPRINLREFRVYTALLTFPPGDNGERWPSRETIGRMTGLPPKVVSRTTSRLQELGWLVKFGDGGRSRTARYIVFDQAQPPGVILNYHTANRTPDTAQDDLPIPPQTDPVDPVNPPQNEPGLSAKGGQNGEGQEVDYLDAVDKREQEPEPARPEPAPQAQAPLSDPVANIDSDPPRSAPTQGPDSRKKESLPTPRVRTEAPDCIPEVWLEQARIQRPDLTPDIIRKSAGIFIDNHRAKGSMMLDWSAAFRVWIARERAPKAPQNSQQATQPVNRYAHLDAKETPVSAAVRASYELGEQRRIEFLIQSGIDPATGWRIEPPAAAARTPSNPTMATPIIPGQTFNASVETRPMTPAEECADFEAKRRIALAQLAALQAAKQATPTDPPINDQADQSYAARLAALEARIAARKAREAGG